MFKEVINTYHSGGITAVHQEGIRYIRSHPGRIVIHAMLRNQKQKLLADHNAIANPIKLIEISPQEVSQSYANFDTATDVGRIVDGEWDKHTTPFNEKIRYKAVFDHFVHGLDWIETGIIDYYLNRICENGRYDGCYTKEDVLDRYQKVDQMYHSMRTCGYDSSKVENHLDHVCVHINRDGEFVHAGNGNHRLSVAKVVEVEKIPVRVVVRHAHWQEHRDRVSQLGNGNITHHPDLNDI